MSDSTRAGVNPEEGSRTELVEELKGTLERARQLVRALEEQLTRA